MVKMKTNAHTNTHTWSNRNARHSFTGLTAGARRPGGGWDAGWMRGSREHLFQSVVSSHSVHNARGRCGTLQSISVPGYVELFSSPFPPRPEWLIHAWGPWATSASGRGCARWRTRRRLFHGAQVRCTCLDLQCLFLLKGPKCITFKLVGKILK